MNKSIMTLIAASIACGAAPLAGQQVRCERGVPAVDLGVTYAAAAPAEEPRVQTVDSKGPGASRLQKGDLIARVNGYPVASPQAITTLRESTPGRALVLTVRRASKLVPVTITPARVHCSTLAALQPTRTPLTSAAVHSATTAPGWLGMGFACSQCEQRVTPEGRVWLQFREYPVIYNVDTGSPAYAAGVRRGDILVRVDGQDVRTTVAGTRLGQVQPGESLRLSYRRANRTNEATVRVARSPVATVTLKRVEAEGMLQSARDLRVSEMEIELRRLYSDAERSAVAQRALSRQLESTLLRDDMRSASSARATLNRLQRLQEESFGSQQRAFEAALRTGEEDARRLGVVGQRLFEVAPAAEVTGTWVAGSPARSAAPSRDDRLRFSGSIGDSDVEVRGPGSVSVQRVGDDLVVVTGDAVVRITQRKPRQVGNEP